MNDRPAALRLLQQRKNIEKFVYRQNDKKYSLEAALLGIEQGQQNLMVFESLKAAKEAGDHQNQVSADGSKLVDNMDDLINDIRDQ